jgi:hypothetical protein
MICLNSIIEPTGRISTMLRTLRASTPVDNFCEVVRIVGMVFSLSWKARRASSPRAPSSAVTRTQYIGSVLVFIWLMRSRTISAWAWVAQKTMVF